MKLNKIFYIYIYFFLFAGSTNTIQELPSRNAGPCKYFAFSLNK